MSHRNKEVNTEIIYERFQDDNGNRWYRIDGKDYPSVTTILNCVKSESDKRFMLACDQNRYNEILVNAGNIGTKVHEYIKNWYDTGQDPDIDSLSDQEFKAYKAFTEVREDYTPIFQEQIVYSQLYGFAGELDFYGDHVKHGKRIVDWKTGQFRFTHQIQVGAYYLAAQEMQLIDPDTKSMLSYFNKNTGKAKEMTHEHMNFLVEGFLSALGVHRALEVKTYKKMNHPWRHEIPLYEYACRKEGLRPERDENE